MAANGEKRRSFYTDLDHLRKCFDEVDRQKNGFIGLQELTELVNSMPSSRDSVVVELMKKLDRDEDGKVSFDDFKWLFELEDSASKDSKLTSKAQVQVNTHSNAALSSGKASAATSNESCYSSNGGEVILRHNARRMTMPARLNRHGRDLSTISPITFQSGKRPPSNDLTDLASQMKNFTDAGDSPKLRRNSKVLSWIESEDSLFEDTGTGLRGGGELPSPPLSPTHHDEASQIGSILESVCSTKEVSTTAIAKLCDHVKADEQEQQELIALLHHLDKDNKGYVSTTEFAQGLHMIKNSVAVDPVTPKHQLFNRISFMETPPRLSEPFSTPQGAKPTPFSSTPMAPSSTRHSNFLTAIDPNQSGYVKIDDVVNYWQKIGVEAPHNQSLENILTETLSANPSGQVSVGELSAMLEGSILTEGKFEGKSQNVLRQVALKSLKSEISTLRTQVNHVSMERDKLKSSLNRTMEEKSKLIAEGDEHLEMITKKSEKAKRQQETKFMERIKEVEKTKQQEALQLQERASNAIKELEAKMKELKGEEEKLREDFKFAHDDVEKVTQQLTIARKEIVKKDRTIAMLQRDLGSRSEHDIIDDETHSHRVNELETEVTEKIALISELQDKLREMQDMCDELKAKNERMKHKNLAQKRSMQKSYSLPNTRSTSARKRSNRPLSGSHFHRRSMPLNPHVPTSMDLDLAVEKKNHPVLQEITDEEEVDFSLPPVPDEDEEELESNDDITDTEDDVFGQSTTSLMEELHQHKMATLEIKQSQDLNMQLDKQKREHDEIVTELKQEISRLEAFSESQQEEALKLEEEKSQVLMELRELKYELESERKSHEVEVNILSRKIDNAENDVTKLDNEMRIMANERKLFQEHSKAEMLEVEKKAESEIAAFKTELLHSKMTISDQQAELLQIKEKLDNQKKEFLRKSSDALAKLESKHMEQTKAIRAQNRATLEKLHEEINAYKQKLKCFEDILGSKNDELEAKASQLQAIKQRESQYERKISALETTEVEYQNEVAKLQASVTKLQEEIVQRKATAAAYKHRISDLRAELQKDADDYISLPSSSRRSSTSSESSKHGEIITRMKDQLEELQKVLESKSAKNGSEDEVSEMELINSLILNNSALDGEMQKLRRGASAERLSHVQASAQKDDLLKLLRAESDKQTKTIMKIATGVSDNVTSKMSDLQNCCIQSLTYYSTKLNQAMLDLKSIAQSLYAKDQKHTSALDALFSRTHAEISRCKSEISQLQQELEFSHHNLDELNISQEQLQRSKDQELSELQSKLEQALKREEDMMPANIGPSRNIKVDAGSGQVISEQDDNFTKDEELLRKEKIINLLSTEIEQLRQSARILAEDTNRKLCDKEKELKESKLEIENTQKTTKDLELKLEQQSHEVDKCREEIACLKELLQSAKNEAQASGSLLELQHKKKLHALREEHAAELQRVHGIVANNTLDARELYDYLVDSTVSARSLPKDVIQLNHSETIANSKKEVDKIREQFTEQQSMYHDLEAVLAKKMEEHEVLEAQFTIEHEEEVRALRQQKRQLMQKLEEVQQHYQNILDNQEDQSTAVIQELTNKKEDFTKQLKEKTEETFHVYQQVADLHEEKRVLVEIIKELCMESGKQLIVV